MNLTEAAAQADELAVRGAERELAQLRVNWDDEIEGAARSEDFRERARAYKAIGQFRFRQKLELLRRGFEDESPACRGSSLVSLELLSRDAPGAVNAVRRLAIVCLRNGSPQPDTLGLLNGLADDDSQDAELRAAAKAVVASLKRKAGSRPTKH
jgi:hypothetical protein